VRTMSAAPEGRSGSVHDWNAIIASYGKSDAAIAKEAADAAATHFPLIEAKSRTREETGSRYSRRIRQGE